LSRFSNLGVVSVLALFTSGFINAWFLTGEMRGLFGTEYGRLVQIKIALFLAMFCLATVNRIGLLPRLSHGEAQASFERDQRTLRQLRRNTLLEIALGLAVIYVVGILGLTPPAEHIHAAEEPIAKHAIVAGQGGSLRARYAAAMIDQEK
jgi:putative copper resistance protein D